MDVIAEQTLPHMDGPQQRQCLGGICSKTGRKKSFCIAEHVLLTPVPAEANKSSRESLAGTVSRVLGMGSRQKPAAPQARPHPPKPAAFKPSQPAQLQLPPSGRPQQPPQVLPASELHQLRPNVCTCTLQ